MSHLDSSANDDREQLPILAPREAAWLKLWLPALGAFVLLCLELYALFSDIQYKDARDGARGAAIATYESGQRQVQQKPNGTLIWNVPRPGETIFRGDSMATLPGAEAVVSFQDHSELVIEPESLIVFEEAPVAASSNGVTGKIVARLVRGSITRRKSGSSAFIIKLSANLSDPGIRFDDLKGDALFRVLRREGGVEVVVESGNLRINESTPVTTGQSAQIGAGGGIQVSRPAKLRAPRLQKPTIEIHSQRQISPWEWLMGILGGCDADADETSNHIAIHFAWDAIEGAASYRLQFSDDPQFASVTSERTVDGTRFIYQTAVPERETIFYFRVAGVDRSGEVGEFSQPEKVSIHPRPIAVGEAAVAPVQASLEPSSMPSARPSPQASASPVPAETNAAAASVPTPAPTPAAAMVGPVPAPATPTAPPPVAAPPLASAPLELPTPAPETDSVWTIAARGAFASTSLSGTSTSAPTLLSYSIGGVVGAYLSDHFLLGATSSFEWTNQYSNTSPPAADWRGTRWNIAAPTVAFLGDAFLVQLDAEFLGAYQLKAVAVDGSTVTYRSPIGFEADLAYRLTRRLSVGLLFHHVEFGTQDSSSGGSTSLQTRFKMTDYGVTASFALYGARGLGGARK